MTTKNIQDVVAERVDKFTTELMHRARYVQGNQYPEDSVEYKAYQAGFESALAMVYIDLTGTPKTEGMLTQLVKEVEAVERERAVVHIQRKGYDRKFAENFLGLDHKMNLTPPTSDKALQDKKDV